MNDHFKFFLLIVLCQTINSEAIELTTIDSIKDITSNVLDATNASNSTNATNATNATNSTNATNATNELKKQNSTDNLILCKKNVSLTTITTSTDRPTTDRIDEIADHVSNKQRILPLTSAIKNFGLKLLRHLNNDKNSISNVAFSPLNVGRSFSMIMSGSSDRTLDELITLLDYSDQLKTSNNVAVSFKIILDDYEKPDTQNEREIKISLPSLALFSKDLNINVDFKTNLEQNYRSNIKEVDFNNVEHVVNEMNRFVENSTNGLVPKLIDNIDADTKLALLNAIYLKAKWMYPFEGGIMREFSNADKTISKVNFMRRVANFDYFENSDIQVVVLPYIGNASMTILLPRGNSTVDRLVSNLNSSALMLFESKMKAQKVQVLLPKFKITDTIDLKKVVSDMGFNEVFAKDASLNGISCSKNLYISKAIHKAILSVDETGTEAASITSMIIETRGLIRNLKRINIDRPFVYLLTDGLNNSPLFMGIMKKFESSDQSDDSL